MPEHGPLDYEIRVSDEELEYERLRADSEGYADGYLESLAAYRKLSSVIAQRDALLMHASVIDCAGRGIAFLARSGVGKTTHTMLWRGEYPSDVSVINGDKPIIRFTDGVPYAYGTPWAGKENMQTNSRVRLDDICFIRRGEDNSCIKLDPKDAVIPLLGQIYLPNDPVQAAKALSLTDDLIKLCRFWQITCNIQPQAARTAHDVITGELSI